MQANSPQLLFSVKIVAPLSTAKCSSVCKTLDANDPFHCVNMNGIDSETYSDLILLLDEQFKFENKHHEDAKQHLDTFLKEVTHSTNEQAHHCSFRNDTFWILIAYAHADFVTNENNHEKHVQVHSDNDENNQLQNPWIPVGFLNLVLLPKLNSKIGYTYVDELFVRTKFRRMGVASLLLNKAKEWTQNLKLAGVRLLVRSENDSAQKLYERNGFVLSETLFGQYSSNTTME